MIAQTKIPFQPQASNTRHPVTPPPNEAARAWLEHFPPAQRSHIANWLHDAVRGGAATPEAVLGSVTHELTHRLRDALRHPEQTTHFQAVCAALTTDRAGALRYATAVLDYEAIPSAERARLKAARARQYQQQWMAQQPPTAKQLAFLARLGYDGPPPAHRLEASAAIDALVTQREGSYA